MSKIHMIDCRLAPLHVLYSLTSGIRALHSSESQYFIMRFIRRI